MVMKDKLDPIRAKLVMQGNQSFLLTVMSVSVLLRYTRYTERIIVDFDEGKPVYNNQIQRKPDTTKVNDIAKYLINDTEALFPTNMVLAIPESVIDSYSEVDGEVILGLNELVPEGIASGESGDVYISVIDGQHRLKGIETAIAVLKGEISDTKLYLTESQSRNKQIKLEQLLKFQIPITFFINPILEYQANIFSIINRTQTKVSEGLVYNLFGLSKSDSPQKTAFEISLALNAAPGSPFRGKVRLVGKEYERGTTPVLSQAAMAKSIVLCISPTIRRAEVERFLPRADFLKGISLELCFRRYYAKGEDASIAKIMYAYFKAVSEIFLDEDNNSLWSSSLKDNILNTTVGYETMLNLLKEILMDVGNGDLFEVNAYKKILTPLIGRINFKDLNKYGKTSVTKRELLSDMLAVLGY